MCMGTGHCSGKVKSGTINGVNVSGNRIRINFVWGYRVEVLVDGKWVVHPNNMDPMPGPQYRSMDISDLQLQIKAKLDAAIPPYTVEQRKHINVSFVKFRQLLTQLLPENEQYVDSYGRRTALGKTYLQQTYENAHSIFNSLT